MGTRRVYGTYDEIQSNGKYFKKFDLGDYEWQTYDTLRKRVVNFSNGLLSIGKETNRNLFNFDEFKC